MKHCLLAAALAVPFAASAADPSDPAIPVAPPAYRSAFADLPTGVEEQTLDWKKANADVAQFPRGHIDLLKWEEAQGRPRAAPPERPAAPAAPAAPRGSAP